ncbi:MAG: translocation/assembly module TamB domain-containing protein [Proteobacteria bacterium]|nr:translocation/assembly module TamB domain-containing protein [Pseudomonadota bacterium]MBU4468886.1 translocation/assembly module TamB domain-containing protein [Pseudomonadota bacterium]MCG2750879.1 translocation/assembly module TamB domain-containing protein [Desulfobacteraceae bacterium]
MANFPEMGYNVRKVMEQNLQRKTTTLKTFLYDMSRPVKKISMALLFVACLMVLFFFVARGLLQSDFVGGWIQGKINQSIPGRLAWKSTRVDLAQGRFELHSLLISEPSGRPVVSVDRLLVGFQWMALFKKNLIISDLRIENPHIRLERDQDGGFDLVGVFSSGEHTEKSLEKPAGFVLPFNPVLKSLQLTGGKVSFRDEVQQTEIHVSRLNLDAEGNLSGKTAKISMTGVLDPSRSGKLTTQPGEFSLAGGIEQDRITDVVLKVDFPGLSASLEGAVRNSWEEAPAINMDLLIQASLEELSNTLGLEGGFSGSSTLKGSVSGLLSNPDAGFELDYQGGILLSRAVESIKMHLTLQDRIATLNHLDIAAQEGESGIKGVMDLQKAFPKGFLGPDKDVDRIVHDYEVTVKKFKIGSLVKSGNVLEGDLTASSKITGKGIHPSHITGSTQFDVFAENIVMEGIKGRNRVSIKGRAAKDQNGKVSADITASTTGVDLKASGHMDLVTGNLAAKIGAQAPDLIPLASLLGLEKTGGSFSLQADLSGSMKKPVLNLSLAGSHLTRENLSLEDLNLNVRSIHAGLEEGPNLDWALTGKGFRFKEFHLDGMESRGSLGTGILAIKQADFMSGDSLVHLAGAARLFELASLSMAKKPSGKLEISSQNLLLEDFMEGIKGRFSVQSRVEGDLADLKGFVTLQGENLLIQKQNLQSISLDAEIVKDRMVLNPLQIVLGQNQSLRVEGWVSTNRTFQLKTLFDQSGLEPYFVLINQPRFSGQATGILEVSGTAGEMASYRGNLDLDDLALLYNHQPLVKSRKVHVVFKDRGVEFDKVRLVLPEDRELEITGGITLDQEANIRAEGRIPMSVLGLFVDSLSDISGDLDITAFMEGPMSEPLIEAEIQVVNVETLVPRINQKVHNTQGRIIVTPGAVRIESLTGQLDSGKFELTGRVDLSHFKPVSLTGAFKSYRMPISISDTLDMTLNTDLQIKGDFEKSTVDGTIVLLEGLYYKDVNLNPISAIGAPIPKAVPPTGREKPTWADGVALNVFVRHRSPFVVDNNVSEMEIVPDLKIKGTLNHPIVLGRTNVASGRLIYRKNVFEIKKGVIDFINPYKTEPSIDIRGESRIRDWLVELKLSGTPDELLFSFSSDPHLEEGDIFSLVILGKTSGEMANGESLSTQSAAQMLSQLMASNLNDNLQKAMGLDVLETEVLDETNQGGSNEMKVTVGKDLSRRLTMKYSARTEKGEIFQRTIAEYKFIENILLNVFQGTHGVFGGSVKYKLEWR